MAGSQWERQGTDDSVAAKLFTLPTIKMRSTTGMITVISLMTMKLMMIKKIPITVSPTF